MEEQMLQHRPSKSKARSHIGGHYPQDDMVLETHTCILEYDALQHGQQQRYYKPIVHHTAALGLILFVALALVGLIEYSLHVLPQHQLSPGKSYGQARKRDLEIQVAFDASDRSVNAGLDLPMSNIASTTPVYETTTLQPTHTPDLTVLSSPTPIHKLKPRSNDFCEPILVQPVVEELQVFVKPNFAELGSNNTSKHPSLMTVLTKQYYITRTPFKSSSGYNAPIKPTLAFKFTNFRPELYTPLPILHKRQVNTCLNSTITPPPITQSSSAYVDPAVKTDLPVTLFMGSDARGGSTPSFDGSDKSGNDGNDGNARNGGNDKDDSGGVQQIDGHNSNAGGGGQHQQGGHDIGPSHSNDEDSGAKSHNNGASAHGEDDYTSSEQVIDHQGGISMDDSDSPEQGKGTVGGSDGQNRGHDDTGSPSMVFGKSSQHAADSDGSSGPLLGKPFTTTVNGQQMVVTPILAADTPSSTPYTTVVDGHEVVVTPQSTPYTTMINGMQVIVTPTPTIGDALTPYTTDIDGKEVVVTPNATPYTTIIDGKEVVVTPNAAPNRGQPYTTIIDGKAIVVTPSAEMDGDKPYTTTIDGHEVVVTPRATPYTTTVDGHEVVVTPRPTAKRIPDLEQETVIASRKGQSGLTTMTLSIDRARASEIAKSRFGNHGQGDMPSSWRNLTFTESDKDLTFIKSPINYFYGVYLPVLLAVLFQMMVYYLYTATKMMEPFAMLSSTNEGIPAKDFLWINYLSANDSLEPFTALASGHWLMLGVSILYTAAQVISPLSSEMLGIYPGYKKTSADRVMAGASLWVHPQIARLMQAILILIGALIMATWFLLRKYQSKVHTDPSSIRGIASLTHHPTTARLFSSIDLSAPKDEILESLAGTRYRLGWYSTSSTERYGIIATTPSSPSKDPHTFYPPEPPTSPRARPPPRPATPFSFLRPSTPTESTNLLSTSPYRSKLRTQLLLNGFFFALLTTLFALILAYTYSLMRSPDKDDTSYRRFMSAGTFGPRFLLTSAGMLVRGQWARLERRGVVRAPFEHAAKGTKSEADVGEHNEALLAGRTLIPITTLLMFLRKPSREMLATALLAFTAVMAEMLVIVLPGVPFDSGQLYVAAVVSRYVSLGLLGGMLLVLGGYWIGRLVGWKGGVKLARTPNTVGTMVAMCACTELSATLGRQGQRELRYGGAEDPGSRERGEKGEKWLEEREVRIVRRRITGREEGERSVIDFDD